MTTHVRIINFGPDKVELQKINPKTGLSAGESEFLYAGQVSSALYLHDSQDVKLIERKPEPPK